MANKLYDKGRNAFARGEIHWKVGGDTIRVMLVDAALYAVNYATDEFLSDVPVAARVGDNGNTGFNQGALMALLNPSAGICDASDTTMLAVPPGGPYEYVLIYKQGAAAGDSQLIALLDTAINLPVTTAGSDVVFSWDNGANKIFKL